MREPLRIDIVSDVMCPWCLIGYRQLARALEVIGTTHDLYWHPFELNPAMPTEGQDLREHLAEKYGTTSEQSERSRQQITALGAELGFAFNFTPDMRIHNTFHVHQLLHWAREGGKMHELKLALFTAYFTDGRDMSDIAVLAEIAGEVGLHRPTALAILQDQRHAFEVRAHEAFWTRQGIRGVPAMVFDGQHLVTGAQGVENYIRILREIEDLRN